MPGNLSTFQAIIVFLQIIKRTFYEQNKLHLEELKIYCFLVHLIKVEKIIIYLIKKSKIVQQRWYR
jgi:hypothetical protein